MKCVTLINLGDDFCSLQNGWDVCGLSSRSTSKCPTKDFTWKKILIFKSTSRDLRMDGNLNRSQAESGWNMLKHAETFKVTLAIQSMMHRIHIPFHYERLWLLYFQCYSTVTHIYISDISSRNLMNPAHLRSSDYHVSKEWWFLPLIRRCPGESRAQERGCSKHKEPEP